MVSAVDGEGEGGGTIAAGERNRGGGELEGRSDLKFEYGYVPKYGE